VIGTLPAGGNITRVGSGFCWTRFNYEGRISNGDRRWYPSGQMESGDARSSDDDGRTIGGRAGGDIKRYSTGLVDNQIRIISRWNNGRAIYILDRDEIDLAGPRGTVDYIQRTYGRESDGLCTDAHLEGFAYGKSSTTRATVVAHRLGGDDAMMHIYGDPAAGSAANANEQFALIASASPICRWRHDVEGRVWLRDLKSATHYIVDDLIVREDVVVDYGTVGSGNYHVTLRSVRQFGNKGVSATVGRVLTLAAGITSGAAWLYLDPVDTGTEDLIHPDSYTGVASTQAIIVANASSYFPGDAIARTPVRSTPQLALLKGSALAVGDTCTPQLLPLSCIVPAAFKESVAVAYGQVNNGSLTLEVRSSADGGQTWTVLGTVTIASDGTGVQSATWTKASRSRLLTQRFAPGQKAHVLVDGRVSAAPSTATGFLLALALA